MEAWQLWREMACESETAARQAEANGHLRSSASRYYYAAYQAVTALLLYRGLLPPFGREAWNHDDTPLLIKDQLGLLIRSRDKRTDLAKRLAGLYQLRLVADYQGLQSVSQSRVVRAGRDARYLLQMAAETLPRNEEHGH